MRETQGNVLCKRARVGSLSKVHCVEFSLIELSLCHAQNYIQDCRLAFHQLNKLSERCDVPSVKISIKIVHDN